MNLHFKTFGTGYPLIILHGLMGSLDNWQTIAKYLAQEYQVSIIDLRNHGRSPHSTELSYAAMVADMIAWMELQNLDAAYVLGHSMGGKVAMNLALHNPTLVSKLIVVDVAPVAYEDRHSSVFQALFAVPLATITTRQQAEERLREKLADESTVQFLMKGLYRDDRNQFQWRFNLPVLYQAYQDISSEVSANVPFEKPTLFIKGANSNYINAANFSVIMDLFPNNQLVEIPRAGHWVHADEPEAFTIAIEEFLGQA